jgi:hypothetical protein
MSLRLPIGLTRLRESGVADWVDIELIHRELIDIELIHLR